MLPQERCRITRNVVAFQTLLKPSSIEYFTRSFTHSEIRAGENQWNSVSNIKYVYMCDVM